MTVTAQIKKLHLNSQPSTFPTMEVADFPVSTPKFTESAWDSGEGGGNAIKGEGSAIKIEVTDYPISTPKFSKSAWGEGGGQGEG